MKEKRALLFQQYPDAGHRIARLFFENFKFSSPLVIGGYWPIGSELDVRPLLKMLEEMQFKCSLPCITEQGMIFRVWTQLTPLVKGPFQLLEPPLTADPVVPNVLLVPLLSFDKHGHRLGYGQGHFDRYLHQHSVLTIGIGFRGQAVDEIPHQLHDFSLDYILTEGGVIVPEATKNNKPTAQPHFFLSEPLISEKMKEKSKE